MNAVSSLGLECKRKVETGFRDLESSVQSYTWCLSHGNGSNQAELMGVGGRRAEGKPWTTTKFRRLEKPAKDTEETLRKLRGVRGEKGVSSNVRGDSLEKQSLAELRMTVVALAKTEDKRWAICI